MLFRNSCELIPKVAIILELKKFQIKKMPFNFVEEKNSITFAQSKFKQRLRSSVGRANDS